MYEVLSELEFDEESTSYEPEETIQFPQSFNLAELNDLTRDLNLSKDTARLLASRLKDKHLLKSDNQFHVIDYERKNSVNFFY